MLLIDSETKRQLCEVLLGHDKHTGRNYAVLRGKNNHRIELPIDSLYTLADYFVAIAEQVEGREHSKENNP